MTYPGVNLQDLDPDRRAVEERRREQAAEFSTYRAAQDIPWGSVTAFFAGEVVPKSTVEARGWLDMGLVERIPADEPTAVTEPAPSGLPAATVPARNAAKSDWVEYAVARGADRTAAEAMTRDELVAQYQEA